MNERTFNTLELDNFLTLAAGYVQTTSGRHRMLKLHPSVSRSVILQELEITRECVDFIALHGRFGLSGIDDPAPIVEHLQIEGTSLEPKQILAVEKILSISRQLRSLIKKSEPENAYPNLRSIADGIPDTRHLLLAIEGKILPSGEIDDNASTELHLIRSELTERRLRIHRTLESIMRSNTQAVQEEIITFRNDRFVIPIRTDSRGQIPGVVHGLSSSGQTTYIEPLTVINQNNDLVRLHEQEAVEISVILLHISDCLRNSLEEILAVIEIVTVLDVSQAKALLATEFHCVQPALAEAKTYELHDARNILLENTLRLSGMHPVPISLKLSKTERALVISGPNAGGKTVTLKTLGLMSLMAQMGFLVPARKACLPVFNQIFADIGDQQSMAANLSTFTAHMRNISEMDDHMQAPSLVLLDEAGTGTDPDEGAALAIAVIDHFRNAGATVVASTHYPRLKMWASQTEGIRNASVEFDENTLQPTYRLVMGTAGSSSGIEIARRMRIKEEILRKAQSLVDPGYAQARMYLRQLKETLDRQETVRMALDSEKAAVEKKYSEMELESEERRQALQKELNSKLESIIHDFKSVSERSVRKIEDRIEAARLKKAIAGETGALRRKSALLAEKPFGNRSPDTAEEPEEAETILQGNRVSILSLDREGTVESISADTFVVSIGAIRYRAIRSDLKKVHHNGPSEETKETTQSPFIDSDEEIVGLELNVIGKNTDEALAEVDKFLDRSYFSGAETIRIIHGHGKGILRKAVAEMLRDHLQVEKFNLAPQGQGGSGATVVELKK